VSIAAKQVEVESIDKEDGEENSAPTAWDKRKKNFDR